MAEALDLKKPLPIGNKGPRNTGLWGVWTLIVTEASLFGYLLAAYAYLAVTSGQQWPPEGAPSLALPGINTVILVSSSGFVMLAERFLRKAWRGAAIAALIVAMILGVIFVAVQVHEWSDKPYGITGNLYGSLYFTITGFHMAHVVVGLVVLMWLTLWVAQRRVTAEGPAPLVIGGLYWHFVDVVWLVIFSTLYIGPNLHA